MTAHELARELLKMPDLPVVVDDGMDPEPFEVRRAMAVEGAFNRDFKWVEESHIIFEC